jgi:arylsulfatase A-like enzyme
MIPVTNGGEYIEPGQVLPPDVVIDLRRAYYSAVSHMDDQVGRVMAALEASGFKDRTIIAFWGDQCVAHCVILSYLHIHHAICVPASDPAGDVELQWLAIG